MKLYTLKKAMYGSRGENLNGKYFAIRLADRGENKKHAIFSEIVDMISTRDIWQTSRVKDVVHTDDGVDIHTENIVYELIDLEFLLPSLKKNSIDNSDDEDDEEELRVVETHHDFKHIHYGDGYSATTYTFNKELTMDEFVKFIENEHELTGKTKETAAWWEPYDEFSGSGKSWTHKRVERYTD